MTGEAAAPPANPDAAASPGTARAQLASVPPDGRLKRRAPPPLADHFAAIRAPVCSDTRDRMPSKVIPLAESVTTAFSSPDVTRRA